MFPLRFANLLITFGVSIRCFLMSFQSIVSQFFQWQTSLVVRWPLPFLLIPPFLTISIVTLTAMDFRLNTTNETLHVFLPDEMESLTDLDELMRLFPPRDPQRDSYSLFGTKFAFVEMVRENGNILEDDGIRELAQLHRKVSKLKTPSGLSLIDVCMREVGESSCTLHPIAYALDDENPLLSTQFLLRYPALQFGDMSIDNALVFGGVTTRVLAQDAEGNAPIINASAVRLAYVLDDTERSDKWISEFLHQMASYSKNTSFTLFYSSSNSLALEMERNGALLIPWMPWTTLVLVVFCMISCSSKDPVKSQPWIGFFAMFNATMATVASTSFLIYVRFPFLPLVFIMPFLVISIGVDNMFLMLKSWRMTAARHIEKRFVDALTETAASLFLTSLTDGLSFSIGSISNFYAVRVFCTYCAAAILCMFLFQITFFNAVMVLCCRRELAGRHSLICCKMNRDKPLDEVAFASRPLPSLPENTMGGLLARMARNGLVRILVGLLYIMYLVASFYYAIGLPLGLDLKLLAPYGSYVAQEMALQERLFNDYGSFCYAVIRTENISLWEYSTRERVIDMYEEMGSSVYASKAEFWLVDFQEKYGRRKMRQDEFISAVHTFLAQPKNKNYRSDIRFSLDGRMEAIKILLRVRKLGSKNDGPRAQLLRGAMRRSNFSGFVYDTSFLLVDQQIETVYNVLTNVVTAIGTMLCICLLMVPRPISSLCIALSILSINFGVVGALSAVSTRLDIISMITIVMSIGFSVDYVTHTTFHFITQREERLERCLLVMTEPILQSALSTVVGVSLLALVPSYIVRTFVFTVFFVVGIGILHGLLFLPILLSTVVPQSEYLEPFNHSSQHRGFQSNPNETPILYALPVKHRQ